jgi:hypothetical protein
MSTLADILRILDVSGVKYVVGHVIGQMRAGLWQYHAGTRIPRSILGLGPLSESTVVYQQEWHCCGKYGCTSGNGMKSARRTCGAVAMLIIESTGVEDQFRVRFDEPDEGEHGSGFKPPAATPPRTLYRTKVLSAEAAADGLSYNEFEQRLPEELRPKGGQAKRISKRRHANQLQAAAKKKKLAPPPPPLQPLAAKKKLAPPPPPPQPLAATASAAAGGGGSLQDGTDGGAVPAPADAFTFCARLLDPLILSLEEGGGGFEAARKHFLDQVTPPSVELFAPTPIDLSQRHWTSLDKTPVPKAWYTGTIKVGNSTDAGQCLFSSIAMLIYNQRGDDVALWLRARCVFELLGFWQLYCAWFTVHTARDMLDSLVGPTPMSRYGYKWPIVEVLWLLSNVLRHRIVVARKLGRKLAQVAGASSFVILPARHNHVDDWCEAPLVVLHIDANHFKPVAAAVWKNAVLALPYAGDIHTDALRKALAPHVGTYCSVPATSVTLTLE